MTVRRVVQLLVCLVATFAVAMAQPKKGAPAPAKDPAPAAGSGSAGSGEAPPPVDEGPPPDMEGKEENPNAPKLPGEETKVEVKAPEKKRTSGYPMEEVLRPITLPANMAEVAIGPRLQVDIDGVGYAGSDTLRARYGITRQVQLGLNYVLAGIYDDPKTASSNKVGFHPGKAIELQVTYLVKDFVGVRLGVPVWIYKPAETADSGGPAVGLTIGVPLKFRFGDKLALGGLDDLLSIKIRHFAPSLEHEYLNAYRAAIDDTNTANSAGFIRFSAYGVYQQSPKLALIGRFGVTFEDFATTRTDAGGGPVTTIRAGLEYTVRKYLDVGISLGFEDLDDLGTFGPTALLAFRI